MVRIISRSWIIGCLSLISLGLLTTSYFFLFLFGMLYFVLGVSVLWGLFERFKIRIIWRVVILVVISLFMGLVIILPIVGLFDTWINFRRLKRR